MPQFFQNTVGRKVHLPRDRVERIGACIHPQTDGASLRRIITVLPPPHKVFEKACRKCIAL